MEKALEAQLNSKSGETLSHPAGFHRPARLGEVGHSLLKQKQLRRLWTPRARATELGRDPNVRDSLPADSPCAPRSRKREKRLAATGEELASALRKNSWHKLLLRCCCMYEYTINTAAVWIRLINTWCIHNTTWGWVLAQLCCQHRLLGRWAVQL